MCKEDNILLLFVFHCLHFGEQLIYQLETSDLLLLLLLSCFSCVRLCVTPQTAAHPALPFLGFSRQEQWSGLPFPSPKPESENEVVSDSQRSYGLQPTRLLHPWDLPGKSTGVGCHCFLCNLLHDILIYLVFYFLLQLRSDFSLAFTVLVF